ncbi:MAG: ABC transporter permease [Candidatus Pacebacteria bacterium]|nr:ABC transporter permease [Candidatus Paceibacterota bacterium]
MTELTTQRAPILVGYLTMLRKEVVRVFRIWSQTLLPPVVTTTLYFAIFGTFIGSQLAKVDGVSYVQFIMPGLVMMSVITSSYSNTVSTFFGAKMQRYLEELLVSPMPNWVIIAGFASGGVVRSMLVGILVLVVALFFTHIAIFNVLIIIGAALLTAILFALAGLVNAIFAKSFDGINIVPTFVLTPLTYLGGVFYSIDKLPAFFRIVSLANPILYMVNAFRYGFLGISDVSIAVSFGVMGGFTVALLILTIWLFNRGGGLKN